MRRTDRVYEALGVKPADAYPADVVEWARNRDPVTWLRERDALQAKVDFFRERAQSMGRMVKELADFVMNEARVK